MKVKRVTKELFSKVKSVQRRIGVRTREALQEALRDALHTVTTQDAQGWFRLAGLLPYVER